MSRPILKKISLGLLTIFVGMQCFRPEKNAGEDGAVDGDLFSRYAAPPEVRSIVENACYDCHSNRTRYPWYAEIQPGGWLLAKHVRAGKRLMNFSEFAELTPKRAKRQLEACIDEIEEGAMPLKSYTWIHHEARLTDAQVRAIVEWIDATVERIEEMDVSAGVPPKNARPSAD